MAEGKYEWGKTHRYRQSGPPIGSLKIIAAMKRFIIRYGVYAIILFNVGLTVGVALAIRTYFPPVGDLANLSLIGPKLTLLSVVIALAIVQYNYFYSESREIEGRIERRDFGPSWANYMRQADEFRETLNNQESRNRMTPEAVETLQGTLRQMDDAISDAPNLWGVYFENNLADFACRFGMISSIALLIFSSVALDFVFQAWRLPTAVDPIFYSLVIFATALLLGFVYLMFMIFMIQVHMRQHHSNMETPE